MKIFVKTSFAAVIAIAAAVILMPQFTFAQDEDKPIDKSAVASTGTKASDFAPKGWKVEEEVKGDVTADGIPDLVIKLIEDKKTSEDEPVNRNRALVVAVSDGKGSYRTAAINDNLLQCTSCGGAFYGVLDAPADVAIVKGVIVTSDESGSRWVSNTEYKFRYDSTLDKFVLIGFDYASRDRAEASVSSESTNYITSKRITETSKGKRTVKKTAVIKKTVITLDELNAEELEGEALKRLGLD
ncbi:MAG TPA: hypothetical protein PK108_10880 [Pyrinomonadaceae bacterium]|nr:hypothetical protein [Chloracidobacterium sp.]MBK9439142.1 hypothetical protein [Chloracidobacterium sp.]MBK9768569.1 hypothetical protein [Chloracidobacterium sp.]MBP9107924.1 hypothetical protein [Pyrinomonadaceae bacterium]HRA41050.1 hypothetical protein [Pyrinomonadaceae bacterium]